MSDQYDKNIKKILDLKKSIIVDFSKYYTEMGGEQIISFYCPHCGHVSQSSARTGKEQSFTSIHPNIDDAMLVQCIFCKEIIVGVDEFSTINDNTIELTSLIKTPQTLSEMCDVILRGNINDVDEFFRTQADRMKQSMREVEDAFKTNLIYQGVTPAADDELREEVEAKMIETLKQRDENE